MWFISTLQTIELIQALYESDDINHHVMPGNKDFVTLRKMVNITKFKMPDSQ